MCEHDIYCVTVKKYIKLFFVNICFYLFYVDKKLIIQKVFWI